MNVLTRLSGAIACGVLVLLMAITGSIAGDFTYDASSHTIQMAGTIRSGDAATLAAMLSQHPDTRTLKLTRSLGGEYNNSLAMSLLVQKHGLATLSSGFCHSGCAYMWLAGASRGVIGSTFPEIHLPYLNATHEMYPDLMYGWFKHLGLPAALADAVVQKSGASNSLIALTPALLKKFGV